MTATRFSLLPDRGVIGLAGPEARSFLQGLISNDIEKVTPERAIYAALLTPQGKYLYDFMIAERAGELLLDVEAARIATLVQRLTMYRLRAEIEITDRSRGLKVAAIFGDGVASLLGQVDGDRGRAFAVEGGIGFIDPRLDVLGGRLMIDPATVQAWTDRSDVMPATPADYDAHRLAHGVPDGSRDLVVERATLLESGFEELDGVDFKKGCFVGQELTARMKYRALVRKRLMPVTFEGPPPSPGTTVKAGGRDIGEMRTALPGQGLALLRVDKMTESLERGETLSAGGVTLSAIKPDWMTL